jgi:hypothetical protein
VLLFGDRAADALNVQVGQTVLVRATLRGGTGPLTLEAAEPLLMSVHPLPVNIRAPVVPPVLTPLNALLPGTSATVLARLVGLARGDDGVTLQLGDATGQATLRVAGDDYAFRLGQNVLLQCLAVVAAQDASPALRFNHGSSVIVEPDMPGEWSVSRHPHSLTLSQTEAAQLSHWFVTGGEEPAAAGLRGLFLQEIGRALTNRSTLQGTVTACVTHLAMHTRSGAPATATVALTDDTGTLKRLALSARATSELAALGTALRAR